jgi:tRNA pseudouridine13 synthase
MPESTESTSAQFVGLDALAYVHEPPPLSASLKQQFSDFRVDEELGFAFTEQGEHVCINIKKTDLSTIEVAKRLSEVTGARKSSIGYAGMKDKRGECTQWFSVQLTELEERALQNFESPSLQILETHRNSRKIRIGSHKSNHFQIRLRDCIGQQSEFDDRLSRIKREGVPNYFGSQRFGWQMSNMTQVQALMISELDKSVPADADSTVSKKRFKRGMLYSAARSYLFNQLLSQRLESRSWNTYLPGDVLNLNGTDRCFVLPDGAEWDQELQQRLDQFDIHITGVLPGLIDMKDKYVSRGESADIEEAVCKQYDTLLEGLKRCGLQASRRAFRFLPSELKWQWIDAGDENENENENADKNENSNTGGAQDLILDFSLPKGAYATSLLRELCITT